MHFHPELPLPEPLEPGTLRLVPLGGLGEVGRNMHVLEYAGRLLVTDPVDRPEGDATTVGGPFAQRVHLPLVAVAPGAHDHGVVGAHGRTLGRAPLASARTRVDALRNQASDHRYQRVTRSLTSRERREP